MTFKLDFDNTDEAPRYVVRILILIQEVKALGMLKKTFLLPAVLIASLSLNAEEHGELIFSDDFERNESQEEKDEVGKGWGTNSKTRANGNKQVDLRDGAMYIYIHETADHGVSVTQPFEFKDGAIGMKFMLENPKDVLGLNFADQQYKKVHAGHLFVAKVGTKDVVLQDLKTGNMDLETRNARKAGTLSKERQEQLKAKQKKFKNHLETGKWYQLIAKVAGDTLSISIDGNEVASFSSEGIAHPTKRMLRLAVGKQAVVDEVKIWRKN